MQENACLDGEWCTASAVGDDFGAAQFEFFESAMSAYHIVVEGIGGDVPYYLSLFESGAILLYVLERYGEGRLAPPVGSPRNLTSSNLNGRPACRSRSPDSS